MKASTLAIAMKKSFEIQTTELTLSCFETYFSLQSWRKYNCIENTRLQFPGSSDPG